MYRLCALAGLLPHLALCVSLVLNPSKTLPLGLPDRSPNKSLSVVPSGFTIQGIISLPPDPSLDEIAVYQTTVAAMEDLAFMNQSAELPSTPVHSWSLVQYDISVDIVSTRVRWAIYGLQMTENMISSAEAAFQPCVGRFFWRTRYEGRVNFMRRGNTAPKLPSRANHRAGRSDILALDGFSNNRSSAGGAGGAEGLLLTADPDLSTITNMNNSTRDTITTTPLHAPQLRVVPTYNGLPMTSKDIFTIALSTMVLGAEEGPETACPGIQGGALDMIPIFDAHGQSLLKYRSLIRAMRVLTRWMVAKNRFGEVDVELLRDGVVIGFGRLKKFSAGLAGL